MVWKNHILWWTGSPEGTTNNTLDCRTEWLCGNLCLSAELPWRNTVLCSRTGLTLILQTYKHSSYLPYCRNTTSQSKVNLWFLHFKHNSSHYTQLSWNTFQCLLHFKWLTSLLSEWLQLFSESLPWKIKRLVTLNISLLVYGGIRVEN